MENKEVGTLAKYTILLFAISIDVAQLLLGLGFSGLGFSIALIPVLGTALGAVSVLIAAVITFCLTVFGSIILSAWFYYLGIKFMGRLPISILFEMIPILNWAPTFTIATWLTLLAHENQKVGEAIGVVGVVTGNSALARAGFASASQSRRGVPPSGNDNASGASTGVSGNNAPSEGRGVSGVVLRNPQFGNMRNTPPSPERPQSDGIIRQPSSERRAA